MSSMNFIGLRRNLTCAVWALTLPLVLADAAQASLPLTPPAAVTSLNADNMATAPKPAGFRYAIIRDGVVDDISETLLYVKARKGAQTSRAVPVPKDRKLLASILAGGGVDDLIKGTIVTVRYDPKGVVRPEIVIQGKVEVEVLDGAKVIDRGGNKLYVTTAEGQSRGFEIEGGAEAWKSVVVNGPASALVAGAKVRISHDPSGRQPLQIHLLDPPVAAAKDKGCGCSVGGAAGGPPVGALLLALGCLLAIGGLHRRA